MKKIFILVFTILFSFNILFLFPSNVYAEIEWTLENGVLTISGQGDMESYSYKNRPQWYEQKDSIIKVIINDGITSVGSSAFVECFNLNEVVLPDTVQFIDVLAFLDCYQLKTIRMSENLKMINDGAFKGCSSLTSIYLPLGLKDIGNEAFFGCSSLRNISIPSSVEYIGKSVFTYCNSLQSATIEANIESIPAWTFYGCESLTTVSLSETVRDVEPDAFSKCVQLDTIQNVDDDVKDEIIDQVLTGGDSFDYGNSEENVEFVENTENASITTTVSKDNVTIDSTIITENGWDDVVEKALQSSEISNNLNQTNKVQINVTVDDAGIIKKDTLGSLAEKNVDLVLVNKEIIYKISCNELEVENVKNNFNANYTLELIETPTESDLNVLSDSVGYYLSFESNVNFKITVKVNVGKQYAYGYASLFENVSNQWNLVQTSRVDREGYASFYFKSFDSLTKYLIGMNVSSFKENEYIVPEELYDDFGVLVDADGNRYKVTGVSSKFGVDIKGFTFIIFGILALVVLGVGGIMFISNKMRQNKEKVRREVMNESKKKK